MHSAVPDVACEALHNLQHSVDTISSLNSMLFCRAVQCQQFGIAQLLLNAGADPMYVGECDEGLSPTPLAAVMDSIPAGSCQTILVYMHNLQHRRPAAHAILVQSG